MTKYVIDDALDAALAYIANAGDRLCVCSTYPTTYTEATDTYMLAYTAMTEGDGNGDYTIDDGDDSGRKLTVAQQANISITNTGSAQHIAIVDTVAEEILLVTEVTAQTITAGGTVTVNAFDDEIADPTA